MKQLMIVILLSQLFNLAHAGGKADPLVTMWKIDQLEARKDGDEKVGVLEAEAWLGYDLKKLWLTADIEYEDSEFEEAIFEILYGQSISAYWDAQVGLRHSTEPESDTWAVLGIKGLAPYYFDIDSSLAINSDGQTHLNINAEYESMLTQKWVLSPEVDINVYGKNSEVDGIGSGLSNINAGLRLRYEVRREFAPYIGINYSQQFGNTKYFSQQANEDTQTTQFLVGISAWF